MNFDIDYIAVVVAALAAFFIGFMWHGPVFGKQWMKLMKITPEDMERGKKEMQGKIHWYMISALVQQIITAYVIAVLTIVTGVSDAVSAVVLAFWLWLGLIATTLLNGVLWEERPVPLYLFNITYQLVSIVVITLIVGVWK